MKGSESDPAPGGTGEPANAPELLTASSAAARLGVAERTIRRAIDRGELRAIKRAGKFHITLEALDQYERMRSRSRGTAADDLSPGHREDAPVQGDPPLGSQPPGQPPTVRSSLPVPLTSLVGREREIEAVTAALRGPERLLTLTGPGGVGKTRLAAAVAIAVAHDFADGVSYVALASITDPNLVAQAIASVLNVREAGGEAIEDRLVLALRERHLLLVLDNFEQVVEAAPLLSTLLAASPQLKILVTSRVRLRLTGEREHPVPPLDLAETDASSTNGAIQSESVRLFIERAHAVRKDFEFTPEHAAAVRAICQRLDGLPLAIELAAARVNVLPPAGLLARLERRLPLLTLGPRDAPARLQTMRDAIAWSYDLLTEEEQTLFRRLAVFVGGFTLEAAEWVGGETRDGSREAGGTLPIAHHPSPITLDLVSALVDKSLLRADVVSGDSTRYSMLETIREFGLEQLAGRGELEAVQQRHAAWYLAVAEDAGPRAKQPGAAAWVEALVQEHANLRAGLMWFLNRGDGQALVRMAGALWPFWHEQTFFAEGHRWLEVALDLGQTAPAADRIVALTGAGTLAWYQTRIEQAGRWHEQALVLAREIGDRAAEAFALINLSAPAMEFGDYDLAFTRLDEGLEAARAVGETEAASLALHNLQCLAWLQGDLQTSQQRAEEALALARAEGWDWVVPSILVNYGLATADLQDFVRAESLLRQGLELGHARGNLWDVGTALEGLARVRVGTGRARQATKLFATAAALRDETGIPQSHTDRAYYEPILVSLREDLGEDTFVAAWSEGRSTSWQTAMADVLASPEIAQTVTGENLTATHGLTQRELEVLRLLAAGQRTRDIGEQLFISPATVATHIANIYGKLGVDSRATATTFAHRHDLV